MGYTAKELYAVYNEIAMERAHECHNCGVRNRLSHSHLVAKSWTHRFVLTKKNIVYHCLDSSDGPGCHTKFESVMVAQMDDFEENFRVIHELDPTYFHLRMNKLIERWAGVNEKTHERILALYREFE